MAKDTVDIEDLEAFIDGLKVSFDTLENIESLQNHLDSADYNRRRKFELVKKIALVREQVNHM